MSRIRTARDGVSRRGGRMLGLAGISGCLLVAVLLEASAQAQGLKPWRQAMILPKADAGFFLMAARRGFAEREGLKVEVLEVKDDPIGMKALLSARSTATRASTARSLPAILMRRSSCHPARVRCRARSSRLRPHSVTGISR